MEDSKRVAEKVKQSVCTSTELPSTSGSNKQETENIYLPELVTKQSVKPPVCTSTDNSGASTSMVEVGDDSLPSTSGSNNWQQSTEDAVASIEQETENILHRRCYPTGQRELGFSSANLFPRVQECLKKLKCGEGMTQEELGFICTSASSSLRYFAP